MGRLRSWVFQILWAGWTAVFALVIPALWLSRSPPTAIRLITRVWARGVLALLAAVTGVRYIERGRELLPPKPCLIVANHQSTWETIAALVLFPDVAIVAKRELLKIPVMGWYLEHSPMVVIDRADAAKALREMTAACRAALSEGRSVLIFPEGTRRAPGSPVIFKRGVEFLYRTLGVPAVVVTHDSGHHWKRDGLLSPGVIGVTILPPIAPGLNAAQFVRTAQTMMGAAQKEIP